MIDSDDPAGLEAVNAAAQAGLAAESRKQATSGSDALDIAGNVMVEGVGEVVGVVAGGVVEGVGSAVVAAGQAAGAVIDGILEGLG